MFCISNQQWSGLHGDTSQRWTMRALNIRLGGAELGNTAEITNINKSYIINLRPRMIKAPFLDNTWHIQFSHVFTRHIPLCDEELGQRAWFGFISSRSDLLHMPTFASVLLFRVRKKVEPAWSHHVSHHVASRGKNSLWTRAWTKRRAPEPWAELLRLSRFRQEMVNSLVNTTVKTQEVNQVEPGWAGCFLQTDGKMREMRVPALAQVKLSPAPLTFGSIAGAPELLETYFNLLYFLLNIIKSY